MAMLNDAKAAKTGKESGEAGSPKAEHKKKKHPKTGVESGEAGTPAAQDAGDDSSGDSDNSQQPSGQGGAQETYQTPDQTTQIQQSGPPPVVNPAAPGAGDESGGSDTPGQSGGQGQDPDEDQASDQADQSQSQDSDQDGDQDQGGGSDPDADQDQDQSASGAPPGGAGDSAPPAAGTPPAAGNDQAAGKEAAKGAHVNADGLPQVPMSPALKEEYQRITMALHKALYQLPGDKAATGVLKSLFPQGPAKIKGVVMASLALITQIHKQLKFPPQLILPFTKDVVSHVMDLGQQVKKIQYSEQECTAILGATLESVMRVFGVSQKQVQALGQHVPKSVLATHVQKYQAAHKFAKSAIDQNNQGWNHPHLAGQGGAPGGQPPGGQPPAAQGGPPPAAQGGAPPAAQGGPPPAAAAPPPAQQGGMLSQAAGGQ